MINWVKTKRGAKMRTIKPKVKKVMVEVNKAEKTNGDYPFGVEITVEIPHYGYVAHMPAWYMQTRGEKSTLFVRSEQFQSSQVAENWIKDELKFLKQKMKNARKEFKKLMKWSKFKAYLI